MGSKGNCTATDCKREAFAKHYCRKHYRLWKRGEMPRSRYKTCTFEKCRKRRFRGSLCEEHYAASRSKAPAAAAAPAAPTAPTAPAAPAPAESA